MKQLQALWNKIIKSGVTLSDTRWESRRTSISNLIALLGTIIMSIFAGFFIANAQWMFLIVLSGAMLSFMSIPLLNHWGAKKLGITIIIIISNLVIFVISILDRPGPPFSFFGVVALPFLLFTMKEKPLLLGSVAFTLVLWFIYDFYLDPDELDNAFHYVIIYTTFATIIVPVYVFINVNADAESQLKNSMRKLQNARQELIAQNEELRQTTEQLLFAQDSINEAKDKAEEGSRAKSQFLSNMSHEMRTPLNGIIGFTDILISNPPDEETKANNLESIKYSANHLSKIINDILDVSKIEAGKIELKTAPFDVCVLVKELAKTMEISCKEKGLNFKLLCPEPRPFFIIGDATRLTQVLLNICGNAVKFTEKGSVTLEVIMTPIGNNKVELTFKVRDTGPGIPKEKFESIFENFARLTTPGQKEGAGLGLAITQKLTKILGGKISLKSELSKGSEFTVSIPFTISQEEAKGPEPSQSDIPNLKDSSILLVEDNEMNQLLMEQLLKATQVNLTMVEDANKALETIDKQDFDLLISDIQLPGMSGWELIGILREKEKFASLPIVVMTADVSSQPPQEMEENNVDAMMTKPFKQNEFYNLMSTLLLEKTT